MKRRWTGFGVLLAVGALLAVPTASAQEDDGKGTAYIRIRTAFAMPYVNGELWDEHAFERAGKTLVMEGLERSATYVVEIRPNDEGLLPATIELTPGCWKLKKISRQVREWRCEPRREVGFERGTAPTEPEPAPGGPPGPADDPDIPPMPGVPPPPPPSDGTDE